MNTIVHMKQITLNSLLTIALLFVMGATQADTRYTYYHNDLFGTPVALTNQAGAVIARKDYTPYDEASGNDGSNHIGFTGHVEDQLTHLTYMQQRMQDPKTGRFLSMDSKSVDPNDPMSFNRYAYANNNPYRYTDPDGDSPIEWVFIAGDVASAGANVASGNYAGAAWDVANIALDAVGPPGASEASHAVKAAKAIDHVADGVKAKKYTAGGKFSKATKQDAAQRAEHKCEYCGVETTQAKKSEKGVTPSKNEAQTDHIEPRSLGGTNAPSNAAHSCRDCNQKFSNSPKSSPREN